jgi:hypothetical protein
MRFEKIAQNAVQQVLCQNYETTLTLETVAMLVGLLV